MYSVGGFRPFHYLNRNRVLILTYHRFSADEVGHRISAYQFEQQLKYLKKYASVVPLGQVADALENNQAIPSNAVVITIDDGYRDAYEVAYPLLKQYQFPASVFVISDFLNGKIWLWTDLMRYALLRSESDHLVIPGLFDEYLQTDSRRIALADRVNGYLKTLPEIEKFEKVNEFAAILDVELPESPPGEYRPMSWKEAREMDRHGIRVESHTVTHPILTNVSKSQLIEELEYSKEAISDRLEREVEHFCYPNGTYNQEVRDAVAAAGYKSAVTTDYGFCERDSDRFRLSRIDSQPSIANFAQSASGFERFRERVGI